MPKSNETSNNNNNSLLKDFLKTETETAIKDDFYNLN